MRKLLWALSAILTNCAQAQWLNYPTPGTPRTRDGKPNLTARAPRAPDGRPDLSGVWRVEATPLEEQKRLFGNDIEALSVPGMERDKVSKYAFNILLDFKPEEALMRPEAAALLRQHLASPDMRPSTHCLPAGVPLATLFAEVHKIIQTPGLTVILLELDSAYRQIYTDGRKLPANPERLWLGYSVGKWEGDTLVVETAGFNDKSWLDGMGHPHSEAMKVWERYRRRDFGHLDVEITIEDPKMYTKPFTIKVTHLLEADSDILEYFCAENEKDRLHMAGK